MFLQTLTNTMESPPGPQHGELRPAQSRPRANGPRQGYQTEVQGIDGIDAHHDETAAGSK